MSWRQVILLFSDETGRHFTACSCMFLMTGSSSSKLASGGRRKLQGRSRRRIGGKTRTVIVMDLGWLAFAWLFRSGGWLLPAQKLLLVCSIIDLKFQMAKVCTMDVA